MQVDVSDAWIEVRFDGRLDTAGVDAVETRFLAATGLGKDVIVNLAGVVLITSMGIRMLVGSARALSLRKRRIVLFGAQPLVAEVLDTAAIDSLVATVTAQGDALSLLGA
jgi:anti-sigma B factor antagonist